MNRIKTVIFYLILLIVMVACSSKKNVIPSNRFYTGNSFNGNNEFMTTEIPVFMRNQETKGFCLKVDTLSVDPIIVISSGKCLKDE